MVQEQLYIREATIEDAKALLEIYAPYVEKTAITFEYDVPSVEEFQNRIKSISEKYPYLVIENDDCILGYAYAGVFKGRAAYDWAVETTIYIREDAHGKGIGRQLYLALEECLKKQGITNLYACIAATEVEDEYLTNASCHFHEKLGYTLIGQFNLCGYKFNRWYHMVWMEKMIGEHNECQSPVKFGQWHLDN